MGLFDIFKNTSKKICNIHTIIIKLDSRKLENPDLDLIYKLPEKIEAITQTNIKSNGYDYISNYEIAVYLEANSIDNVNNIIDLFNKEKICGNDLSKMAEIFVSSKDNAKIKQCVKIYPTES